MSDHSHILKKDNSPYSGFYLCGQDALNKAAHIRNYIKSKDLVSEMALEGLADLLESCFEGEE